MIQDKWNYLHLHKLKVKNFLGKVKVEIYLKKNVEICSAMKDDFASEEDKDDDNSSENLFICTNFHS